MRSRIDLALAALLIGFVILASAVAGSLWIVNNQGVAQQSVLHTLEVQRALNATLSRLQDAEIGQRGYLLTANENYLAPYTMGRVRILADIKRVRALVDDNPRQLERVNMLQPIALARIDRLEQTLKIARSGDIAGARALVADGVGLRLMDRCRTIIATMQAEEAALFDARAITAKRQATLLIWWLVLSVIAVVALGYWAMSDSRRRLRAITVARDELVISNRLLAEESHRSETAEAQLRQMQKMESIGQLTGGIAHDFNNMLAIVIGSLDLAQRRMPIDPRRAEQLIDNALEGANRAAQLTARLLAFSRQQPLAPNAINLNGLVAGMSELLRRSIGETVRIETVLAGGLWPTFVDPGQLENAIVNLCVNARDAMPGGGKLTLETSNSHLDDAYAAAHGEVRAGQYVLISITDTGTGMPADVIERAFDPFFTTKGIGKGTGLGLSQVYGFVKQTGGHVKIYSEPNVGTTLKIYLPRHFGEAGELRREAIEAQALPIAVAGEVVMVVEDDERVRAMSVQSLIELGYTVIDTTDSRHALTLLKDAARIDLLFTDIVMPEFNGKLLADAARDMRPGLRVLYTTGYTRNAIVHNGMLDHDVAFLAKPFSIGQLAIKVRQVLDDPATGV